MVTPQKKTTVKKQKSKSINTKVSLIKRIWRYSYRTALILWLLSIISVVVLKYVATFTRIDQQYQLQFMDSDIFKRSNMFFDRLNGSLIRALDTDNDVFCSYCFLN